MSQTTRWIGMTMLLALAAAAPVRAELKIGVVDMQRALNDFWIKRGAAAP